MDSGSKSWVQPGQLYVVATPIGNLADLSPRAADVLRQVSRIAAEDTRDTSRLLQAFGITTNCVSVHEHNERGRVSELLSALQAGESLALVSDAGTPLISDPGYVLVRAARDADIPVIVIPGPCAVVAALSIAGIATDRFAFEGFLPAKSNARCLALAKLAAEPRTLVFYESPHRIVETLADMHKVLGGERRVCIARELSKRFEQSVTLPLAQAQDWMAADSDHQRGEFVLVLEGGELQQDEAEALRVAGILSEVMEPSAAARCAAKITGVSRKWLYQRLAVDKDQSAAE